MQFDGGMTKAQAELEARAVIERRLNPPAPKQMSFSDDPLANECFAAVGRLTGGW
ncbi:hypothetical protein [Geobacter sp. SVR]|uniref:hypothetical protein n=1 Tax=Geobacter sp. SVR TaxID=2495594 RepID=UPI00143EF8BE|nr:hypothetical protein [Geobacter sp. SVR]BCS54535.1 hypothetical protein GSVR_28430 [Geobacter sp. SVR]GCF87135.1 hypothetical protein GSbR_37350 [Geobacter sp. SVR]